MIQLRKHIFETNSSTTHSLTMCTEVDWLNWEKGSLVFDNFNEELISRTKFEELSEDRKSDCFLSPDDLFDWASDCGYETFKSNLKGIIAFGYCGY